jgi:SAM-dependent methyltransferase
MTDPFTNVYDDDARALAYAGLEFPGTYYLAFRDLPALVRRNVVGRRALDFGCGAGRSSRFLRDLGFEVTGVDISPPMLAHARERDPDGTYLLVPDGDLGALPIGAFDLVFSAFTFDNVPGREARTHIFHQLHDLLAPAGTLINLVSAPEIYLHEWTSFSTRAFDENRRAGSGDRVRIVMLDVPDRRPVEDVLWLEADYLRAYGAVGLAVTEIHRPLGTDEDPFTWVSETHISPWAVYLLRRAEPASGREESPSP